MQWQCINITSGICSHINMETENRRVHLEMTVIVITEVMIKKKKKLGASGEAPRKVLSGIIKVELV